MRCHQVNSMFWKLEFLMVMSMCLLVLGINVGLVWVFKIRNDVNNKFMTLLSVGTSVGQVRYSFKFFVKKNKYQW
jgi:hypothetical protein